MSATEKMLEYYHKRTNELASECAILRAELAEAKRALDLAERAIIALECPTEDE